MQVILQAKPLWASSIRASSIKLQRLDFAFLTIEHSIIIASQTGQSRTFAASQPLETQDTMSFWTYVSTYPERSKNEDSASLAWHI